MLALLAGLAAATPIFSTPRGLYDAPFELTLSAGQGGTIAWSADGSAPTRAYTAPIAIDRTVAIRAVETLADGTLSPIETHTFVFVDQVLSSAVMAPAIAQDPVTGPIVEQSLRDLPTVSVVLPSALSLTEQGGSIEWIDPAGDDTQVDCGVHIVGGTSWAYPKTSIRLNFRSEYGVSRWEFDVYGPDATGTRPTDEFDAITLRSGNHDTVFWLGERAQHLRNFWFDETQLEMGHTMPHGRFAHVYVGGVYHGLYHVRERFGAGFMESYYGGDEADYETWTGTYVEDGSGAAWGQVTAAAGDYETFARWVDVPQYLDYMVLNYYAGNAWDWWSWHNWMTSGPIVPDVRGGFVFHGNDNDITLDYAWDVNILYLGGPADLFPALLAERHPDFLVALQDAIHRNLEADGPLSAENAGARYDRLAQLADDAIWAESARWGEGWWDHDGEWVPERDDLLNVWFPRRTDEVLRQFRAEGWYPFDAPVFGVAPGVVAAGTEVAVTGGAGELWVTVDGRDPRLPGGAIAPTASLGAGPVRVDRSTVISARIRVGNAWGPLATGFWEVEGPSPVVLNEWNAVEPDVLPAEGDPALGHVVGNGGDWLELVITEDGTDLRGWRLTMADRLGPAGELTFSDDPMLADLRAGTLITIAEDLAEDPAYDPDAGDWRFHLRAADGASGAYVSATGFDVTPLDWRLTVWDAAGNVRFGPVGESIAPFDGLSGAEVGRLEAQPDPATPRDDAAYDDGDSSSFGAPNTWGDEVQDLGWDPAVAGPVSAEPVPEPEPEVPAAAAPVPTAGKGCATAPPAAAWLALLALAACGRRSAAPVGDSGVAPTVPAQAAPDDDLDRDGFPADEDCDDGDPSRFPGAPEQCDAEDDDCDGFTDEEPVDGLPFHADADGDGYGAETVSTACGWAPGLSLVGDDCDDADPDRHPDAIELCDAIDQDCDGAAGDEAGASSECPVESCLAALEADPGASDGPYWLALPSGEVAEVWCDQTTDGGGWTLGFLRNSASTADHAAFGGADEPRGALWTSPHAASASAVGHAGWIDLNGYPWTGLVVAAYAGGAETYRSREIARTDLRIPFGSPGYLLYGAPTGYWWCGGPATYTDAGIGAVNNPAGAPADCKSHGGLGSGWDFSEGNTANLGLTLCGPDASNWLYSAWASGLVYFGTPGGAQAIWVR